MSNMRIVIPTRNRARYLKSAVESLLASLGGGGCDVTIDIFNNYSKDDTEKVAMQLSEKYECVRYKMQVRESFSAEESAYLALCELKREGDTDFFWLFGDDDVAAQDACAKIYGALEAKHDFVLAGLSVVADGVDEVEYYSMTSSGVSYTNGIDLFRDFGLVTATTTLSCLSGRLSALDLDFWGEILSLSPVYSHSFSFLHSFYDRRCAALSGTQVRYKFNSVEDELSRLRAGGLTTGNWTLWPYTGGLRSLIMASGLTVRSELDAIDEVHISKDSFDISHGTLLGFLFDMYIGQALLYADSGLDNERITEERISELWELVALIGSDDIRQMGFGVCEALRGVRARVISDKRLLLRARMAVNTMQELIVRDRFGGGGDVMLETRGDIPIKPLRGARWEGLNQ